MLDVRADSIIYQSQVKFASLIDELVTGKRLGKARDEKWAKALLIRRYLKALEYRDHLDDITQANYILEQLIELTGINEFPVAPTLLLADLPAIIVGKKGDPGDPGAVGATGATGFATDFLLANTAVTAIVDAFLVTAAKGAKWDYIVNSLAGDQRSGTVLASWKADGSSVVFLDTSTSDIGDTTGLEFNVLYSGGSIQLQAVIASGSWTINGTRYYIPSNGNGSGAINNVLTDGWLYVGNSSNQAQQRQLTGAISITDTGISSIVNGTILNAHINASAAIAVSKLVALTASRLVVTDASGFLTISSVTSTEAGYLSGVTSNIQTQLDSKLSSVSGAISPWTSANFGSADVVAISNGSNKLAVSTITTTELSYLASATSNIQTQLNNKQPLITVPIVTVPSGSPTLNYKVINIGNWNMDTVDYVSVAHGIDPKKIRSIDVAIRNDADNTHYLLRSFFDFTTGVLSSGYFYHDAANVNLYRLVGSVFDDSTYSTTGGYNRGYITILYES